MADTNLRIKINVLAPTMQEARDYMDALKMFKDAREALRIKFADSEILDKMLSFIPEYNSYRGTARKIATNDINIRDAHLILPLDTLGTDIIHDPKTTDVQLDPRTVNQLLNSDILDKDEKRMLLKQMGMRIEVKEAAKMPIADELDDPGPDFDDEIPF